MESGGQIERTALALSVLTGKPFKIDRWTNNFPGGTGEWM
jgi:RNA 3'-terminal phosphate cyclase